MPLKHTTETLLIFLLAVATIATGILMQSLPALPEGIVPWAIVFVAAVGYPLSLASVFRRNRADNAFRLLHWVPAAMLLIWLALQGLQLVTPATTAVLNWYTWGWSLPAVATGIFLLAVFVFRVIRRWTQRIFLLLLAFVPFVVGAVANQHYDWNDEIAATLWQGDWWKIESTGSSSSLIAQQSSDSSVQSSKNLDPSPDPVEESYRERLRAIERRRQRIAERMEAREQEKQDRLNASTTSSVVVGMTSSAASSEASVSSSMPSYSQTSSKPASLPSSGFGWAAIALLLVAGYCSALQRKTVLRTQEQLTEA